MAFVIPWFAAELKRGSEQQAQQIAIHLTERGHRVEVLTTCCRSSFDDWSENHFPEGITVELGVTTRRFPVDARKKVAFDGLYGELLAIQSAMIWVTGLSGAGKSPLAHAVEARLHQKGCRTFVLDGHNIRYGISAPYEEPENPDLVASTGERGLEACVEDVLRLLESRDVIMKHPD